VDQDILIFLEYNLELIGQDDAQEPGWPEAKDLQHLVHKASGLFIWAATACWLIRDRLATDERLRILLDGGNYPPLRKNTLIRSRSLFCEAPSYQAIVNKKDKGYIACLKRF
jgi:hypothetical protein